MVCKRKLEEVSDDLVLTQQLLQENRINRESYDSSYHARSIKRGTELEAVEMALNLIQTNAE